MERIDDTFAVHAMEVEDVAAALARALNEPFEARESLYYGGDYYESAKLRVQRNNDGDEDDPLEDGYDGADVLVCVSPAAVGDLASFFALLHGAVPGLAHVKTTFWDGAKFVRVRPGAPPAPPERG